MSYRERLYVAARPAYLVYSHILIRDMLVYFSALSLRAVVVWQIVTLVDKYENPSTSFEVSVSSAHSDGRFEPARTSCYHCVFNSINLTAITVAAWPMD